MNYSRVAGNAFASAEGKGAEEERRRKKKRRKILSAFGRGWGKSAVRIMMGMAELSLIVVSNGISRCFGYIETKIKNLLLRSWFDKYLKTPSNPPTTRLHSQVDPDEKEKYPSR